jgi:hypothetical protein
MIRSQGKRTWPAASLEPMRCSLDGVHGDRERAIIVRTPRVLSCCANPASTVYTNELMISFADVVKPILRVVIPIAV